MRTKSLSSINCIRLAKHPYPLTAAVINTNDAPGFLFSCNNRNPLNEADAGLTRVRLRQIRKIALSGTATAYREALLRSKVGTPMVRKL